MPSHTKNNNTNTNNTKNNNTKNKNNTKKANSPPRRMINPLKTLAKNRRGSPKTPPDAPNHDIIPKARALGPRALNM
tara:strand:- start:349 stop:579 length:231 start_codon:yes stop_codon:yes gene_type:complete